MAKILPPEASPAVPRAAAGEFEYFCQEEGGTRARMPPVAARRFAAYFSAASVIAWVQAPSGALVITGSEPPDSSEATVRS